ncbi:MAG: hypothetical protein K8T90_16215 [Planctomycetes bacterium]|nr:hypothetical protein [Planctomycetota bacterium]
MTNAVRKLAKVRRAKDRLQGEAKEKAEKIEAERATKETETGDKPRGRAQGA